MTDPDPDSDRSRRGGEVGRGPDGPGGPPSRRPPSFLKKTKDRELVKNNVTVVKHQLSPTACRCGEETTGQVSFGHCLHCGAHVGARTRGEWSRLVKAPCPRCGRPW